MLGPRGYLFHCHAALFRRVPLPRSIRRQQSADLFHQLRQLLIPSARKGFVLFADERQRAVDLRKLLRLKKGAFLNKPAAHGEVPLGGVVVVLKIMSVMDALSVEVPFPGYKLDTARSIGPWNVSEKTNKRDSPPDSENTSKNPDVF